MFSTTDWPTYIPRYPSVCVSMTFRPKVCTRRRFNLCVCSRVNVWAFQRKEECMFTLVLGAVVSMYTLTLLLSQVDRQVFTSRISSLSTNCCALQPWYHKGSTLIKNSTVFMSCIYRKTSTSQLYAHLFVNMCKIYWMLNALYEDLFKSYVKITSRTCFSSRQSLDTTRICKSLL